MNLLTDKQRDSIKERLYHDFVDALTLDFSWIYDGWKGLHEYTDEELLKEYEYRFDRSFLEEE